jgi:hypothetical protein
VPHDPEDWKWMQAADPRWEPETRAFLLALERREAWVRGFRIHLVREHGTKEVDACGCRLQVPADLFG